MRYTSCANSPFGLLSMTLEPGARGLPRNLRVAHSDAYCGAFAAHIARSWLLQHHFMREIQKISVPRKQICHFGTKERNITMKDINESSIDFYDGNINFGRFSIYKEDYTNEKSIILCEIYNKDNLWRINLIARGGRMS